MLILCVAMLRRVDLTQLRSHGRLPDHIAILLYAPVPGDKLADFTSTGVVCILRIQKWNDTTNVLSASERVRLRSAQRTISGELS